MRSERRKQKGLTLIEVLVAMGVLAGAVGAVLMLMGTQTRGAAAITDNALARIAAENAMVQVLGLPSLPLETGGEAALGGRDYAWRATTADAPLPGLRVVEVEVRAAGGTRLLASLATLTPEERQSAPPAPGTPGALTGDGPPSGQGGAL